MFTHLCSCISPNTGNIKLEIILLPQVERVPFFCSAIFSISFLLSPLYDIVSKGNDSFGKELVDHPFCMQEK